MLHAGLIYWLSSRSQPVRHYPFVGADKVVHAGAFGVLAFLVAWGLFRAVPRWPHRRSLLAAFLAAVLYGWSDEIHQIFVPRRYSDPLDLAADATGALIAVVLVYMWEMRLRRRGRVDSR